MTLTPEVVDAARSRVREELRDQGLEVVPDDERVIRAALPLFRLVPEARAA